MGVEEAMTETPNEVVEAVKKTAQRFRREYERNASQAAEWQDLAQATFDAASAARAKAEACEKWLDERVPDWREIIVASKEDKDDRPPRDYAEEPIG